MRNRKLGKIGNVIPVKLTPAAKMPKYKKHWMLRFPFASNQDLSVTFSVIRKFNKKSNKAFLLPTPCNLPNYQLQSTIPVTILVHVIRDDFEIITKLIKSLTMKILKQMFILNSVLSKLPKGNSSTINWLFS